MANFSNFDLAMGYQNALQSLAPRPIIARRNPKTTDQANPGQIFINSVTLTAYICIGTVANVTTWTTVGASANVLAQLTVTPGPISLTGVTTINSGGANNVSILDGASSGNLTLNAGTGTGAIEIGNSLAGAFSIESGAAISITNPVANGLALVQDAETAKIYVAALGAVAPAFDAPVGSIVLNTSQTGATNRAYMATTTPGTVWVSITMGA